MQIPSIPPASQEPSLLVSTKNVPLLQVGEIVQAEVLTVTDTAVAIRMKNAVLEARSNLPLKQGEVLSLLVEETGQDLRLRLLQGNGDGFGSIKSAILSALDLLKDLRPAAGDVNVLNVFIRSMPQALKETLPGLGVLEKLMVSLEELSGSVLKNAVQDSGVFFETKLRLLFREEEDAATGQKLQTLADSDMKAGLLKLREALETDSIVNGLIRSGVRTDAVTAAVDNLIKNVEFLQLQSRLSDTLQVFVPFIWQDLKDGEFIFRESEPDASGEESFSCTVNLELERAGRMSARVLLLSGYIHVDLLAENDRFCNILHEGEELLRQRLSSAGIKLGGLTVRHEPAFDFKTTQRGGYNKFI